jgi:mono/diheme cytochrome c family protein
LAIFAAVCGAPPHAAEAKPQPKVSYVDNVRPIFREHCFACHNQNKATNDLALDSYERVLKGGASGEAVKAGSVDDSYLWQLVSHQGEPSMPPKQDKLPEAKLQVIKQWILDGALKDAGSSAQAAAKPKLDLSMSAGAGRPAGPAILPTGLGKQPIVRTAHATAVTAMAASPWAPLLAVAGPKQILFYQTDTAALFGVLPFPEGIAYSLKFSRSGSLLLVGGGHAAVMGHVVGYDVRSGRRLFELGDELDAVLAADINENHTRVALGGPQRVVRVYATADGSLVHEIKAHTDWVYAVEYSPDGVLLATADRSGGLHVWEAETAQEYQDLQGHKDAVTDLSWRDDSTILASASEDGTIKLWEMNEGKLVKSWKAHEGGVLSVRFAHDGRLVSAGRDRKVEVWGPDGRKIRGWGPLADLPLKVAFTHDGSRVLAGDWTGQVLVWSVAGGKAKGREPVRLSTNP